MRPKGLERNIVLGEVRKVVREVRREVRRGERPEAFSIIDLEDVSDLEGEITGGKRGEKYRSMTEMMGATRTAAEAAEMRSAPRRKGRFLVFHFVVCSLGGTALVMVVVVLASMIAVVVVVRGEVATARI